MSDPGPYRVITEQVEKNPSDDGTNQSGVIVYITDGRDYKKEVSRVGVIRRNSKNPNTSFPKQLQKEMKKAEELVVVLNDTFQLDPTEDLL